MRSSSSRFSRFFLRLAGSLALPLCHAISISQLVWPDAPRRLSKERKIHDTRSSGAFWENRLWPTLTELSSATSKYAFL